jgi:glycosyltransferase involved in cell wall biosynthesis
MRRHPELTLVLAGEIRDPRYWAEVQQAAGGQLVHVGAIPHHSPLLRSAYAACEVFVLPSLFETPGLAALEAAGQGARIAMTREGSTTEYFGDTVHYLNPASVDSIAEAIAAARAGVPCSYVPSTWSGVTRKLAAIYAELV